jgi:hypothetical protein
MHEVSFTAILMSDSAPKFSGGLTINLGRVSSHLQSGPSAFGTFVQGAIQGKRAAGFQHDVI